MVLDEHGNIPRHADFGQVVIWEGTTVGEAEVANFEKFILDELGTRVQYLEEISTNPDTEDGRPVENTGGRVDLFFAVHSKDISKFAIPRFQYGMKWIEDVFGNGGEYLYPDRVAHYKTW